MSDLDLVVGWLMTDRRTALRDARAIYQLVAMELELRVCAFERCAKTFGGRERKYCCQRCMEGQRDLNRWRRRKAAKGAA